MAATQIGKALDDGVEEAALAPIFRPLAAQLPYELLHTIFLHTAIPSRTRPPHGGAVRAWHTYEAAAPLALVCRAWRQPAQAVLFSSVALIGHRRAEGFLSAIAGSPRARKLAAAGTVSVVLALDAAVEASPNSAHGQLATSLLLVAALEACSTAAHVHIRALHHDVRERLHGTLMRPERPLVSLVVGPRNLAAAPWSARLWQTADWVTLRPTVENLEHTALISPFPALRAAELDARVPALVDGASLPTLALRRLKLWYDWPVGILVEALRSSPNLEFLDLYFEHPKPTGALVEALRISAPKLRHVRYLYNPTVGEPDGGSSSSSASAHSQSRSPSPSSTRPAALFDLLLPQLRSLSTLHCSATDLTPSALLALPGALTRLYIKSFNARSRFPPRALLRTLERADLQYPDRFVALEVVDSPDAGWDDATIERVRRACEARGVRFVFKMDFEEEGLESSTTRGSEPEGDGSVRVEVEVE